jgi:predicted transcriptional regulator
MKTSKPNIDPLSALDIKPITREVLSVLARKGRSPAADIAVDLNKPKSSIYDGLDELLKLGLITEESSGHARIFVLAKEEQVEEIKKTQVSNLESAFAEVIRMSQEQETKTVARPRIRFYSGKEGIQQAFRDTQWTSHHKDAYLMWPMKDMIDTLGENFLKFHSEGRLKHKVMIHSIRKDSDRVLEDKNYKWLEDDTKINLREVRYAPRDLDWNMSFWAYGDQTLFAGSGSEYFAFIMKSKEFTDLMILLWEQMWEKSTK